MKKTICVAGILFLSLAMIFVSDATAATVGKITGRVLDNTGGPLPGANVVIEGTRVGASTDESGYYVILAVDPGLHTLTASLVGYQTETKTDVRVEVDHTTEVTFTLAEAALELEEMVVKAVSPPVEVDKTFSKYTVGADEIENLPIVRSTSEMITLQPGVHLDGSGRMRGSTSAGEWRGKVGGDVAYYVDGVKIVNSDGADSHQWQSINRSAVQEIAVVTGGMNAEFGNAQAGVVNIVTKDGGQSFRAWTEYKYHPGGQQHWGANIYDSPMHRDKMKWGDGQWENERNPATGRVVHKRSRYDEVSGHEMEGTVSGPLTDRVSFILSGSTSRIAPVYPSATERGFLTERGSFVPSTKNFQGSSSFAFRLTTEIKVKVGGLFSYNDQYMGRDNGSYRNIGGLTSRTGTIRGIDDNGKNLFLPEEWSASGKMETLHDMEYVAFTHSLSAKTFYDLRISRYRTRQDTVGSISPRTGDPSTDEQGWFVTDRQINQWGISDRRRYQLKFDLASQVTKGHFLKVGMEAIKYSVWQTRFSYESPTARRLEYTGAEAVIGNPSKPLHLAFYVQDKMEFEGMVINAGLRIDRLDPVSKFPSLTNYAFSPMYFSPLRYQNAPMKDPRVFTNVSPRFGVSHPITDKASMHYFVGLFLAYPDVYWFTSSDWRVAGEDNDWNDNGRIDSNELYNAMRPYWRESFGTSDLRPEQTVSMEVGADWNFVSNYVAAVALYYKSAKDQFHYHSDARFYAPHKPGWMAPYARMLHNNGFEEQRGLEFSLSKSFTNNFAFNLSYNLTDAQQAWGNWDAWFNFMYPDSTYIASGRYWYEFTVQNGQEVPVPLTEEQIRAIGHTANNVIRNNRNRHGRPGGKGYEQTLTADGLDMPISYAGYTDIDEFNEEHLKVWVRGYYTGLNPDGGDIRNQASLQFVYHTPPDYGPDARLLGSKVLANWRVNLIWRLQNTGGFWYTPPNAGRVRRARPVRTWTDLAVEKRFPFGGGKDVSLFMQVRNMFNQADDSSFNTTDWVNWGLQRPRPDNSEFVRYGDLGDRSFYGAPRKVEVGLRSNF